VYISGAASLIIYIYLNYFFESLSFYISCIWSAVTATLCLILYAAIHVATKDDRGSRATWKNGILTFALLLLYVTSFASYTYTYNMLLFGRRAYRICRGTLLAADTGRPLPSSTLTFTFADNTTATATTDAKGYFFQAVSRDRFVGLRVRSGLIDSRGAHCQTLTPGEFADTVELVAIPVNPCMLQPEPIK
jgi:hypothetical protein